MLKQSLRASAALLLLLAGTTARAQDSALLDLLVKKRIINAQEAEDVRADLIKEQSNTSAGKIAIGSWVNEMKLGGDLRMRYQYDNRDFQVDPPEVGAHSAGLPHDKDSSPSGSQRSRWRFRLRIRDEFKLADNWFGGVELSTSSASDSGNQTFENGFGKYNIFISRAYLGWNATDWLTFVAGKQPNPFYTTDLVWDPDINPDGFVQTVRLHKMYFGGESSKGGYSKDGKSAAVNTVHEDRPWELTLNMGEFIFDDNIENGLAVGEPGVRDNDAGDDAWLFVAQLVGSYKFGSVKATFAPGVMFTNAARLSFPAGTNENQFSDLATTALPSGDLSFTGETRKELILTAPGDVSFKLGSLATKLYWDFAYNTQGKERSDEVYKVLRVVSVPAGAPAGTLPHIESQHQTEDDFAWLVGFQLGENKKRGDWSLNANYRHIGLSSVEPNLNDSDFALGELNTRGFKVGLFYNLTDFATLGANYYYAWNLRDNLIGGSAAVLNGGVADANNVQVLQVDLSVKF